MEQINANTGMYVTVEGQTTTTDANGNVQPFAHLSRLADKIFGAVLTGAEQAVDRAMQPDNIAQPAPGQFSFIPQDMASYINRNAWILMTGAILTVLVMFLSLRR